MNLYSSLLLIFVQIVWISRKAIATENIKRLLTNFNVRLAHTPSDHFRIETHIFRVLKTDTSNARFTNASHGKRVKQVKAGTVSFMCETKDGCLIGSIQMIIHNGHRFSLQNMIVSSEFRRRGVASKLLSAVEDFITSDHKELLLQRLEYGQTSISMLELDVDRNNPPAINLYNKCGFLPTFSFSNLLNHRQKMFKIVQLRQRFLGTTANSTSTTPSILELNVLRLISFIILMTFIDGDFKMYSNQ
jgi:ribosomal protein S18 acetylase RimI-like enzyme